MNVPKLRFKEFNNKYNITKVSKIIDVIDGDRGNNYPKANDFYDSEFCLFLNAGNVTKNGFNFKNNQFITKEKDKKLRKSLSTQARIQSEHLSSNQYASNVLVVYERAIKNKNKYQYGIFSKIASIFKENKK